MDWVRWSGQELPPASVLVEGLPGVGHVGALVAEHLVARLEGKLVARIHSPDFPPQAVVEPDGTARLVGYRIFAVPAAGDAPALLVLTGDCQPLSAHGQYETTTVVLERAAAAGCTTVYTLGGLPEPGPDAVVGTATTLEVLDRVREAGASCESPGPHGGILGASGVFLGLAGLRGMEAACIMGRSKDRTVDIDAARNLLPVLARLLGRDIPLEGIEETAAGIERMLDATEETRYFAAPRDADHHYIG